MIRNILLCFSAVLLSVTGMGQTVIVDNADSGFAVESGLWETGTVTAGKFGDDYRFAETTNGNATARCRFTPDLPLTGYYYVSVWYNTGTNRSSNAPYTVHGDEVTSTVRVDQQINGARFFYIGQLHFSAGSGGSVSVANDANNLVVMADAVQWEYAGETPGPEPGGPEPGGPEGPELRGLWVSRFEWPRTTEAATKANLDSIIGIMADANFNSIFLQVRGAMETFYPSPNEPWAKETFGYQPQDYDPLAYAITKCHDVGIQFHAYINTHTISQGLVPPNVPLGEPVHQFYIHGNPSDPAHSDWVYHTSDFQPQPLGEGEDVYNWTAPGVPAFQTWTRDQVLYVAENYNVDGVHFDRIRFSGEGSYDPISLARSAFNSPTNPDNLGFRDWNRDQVTRLLNDIYGAVAEVNYNRGAGKPFVQVSTAPFRGQFQQESVNQMVGDWNALGAEDFFVPQVYTGSLSGFESTLATNFPISHGRHVVAGMSRNSTGNFDNTRAEIEIARQAGAAGTVIFSYTAFGSSELNHFAETIYTTKVDPPAMEWITTPTQAIVVGTVTGPDGLPVQDAQLQLNSSAYTWLSGADGFYSMLKLPADTALELTVTKSGLPVKTVPVMPLAAGEVRRVNVAYNLTGVDDWTLY